MQRNSIEDKCVESGDLHNLVKREVDARMKPFVVYISEEHEQTRKEVKNLAILVGKLQSGQVNDIIQYVLIAGIILSMLFLQG